MANIKEEFPEFYQSALTIDDLDDNSDNLIVLDSNFLLDVLRIPTDLGNKYIEALKKIKKNLYIPYLVALEFNFNKSAIKKEKEHNIKKYEQDINNTLKNLDEKILKNDLIKTAKNTDDFSEELLKKVSVFRDEISKMLKEKIFIEITKEETTVYNDLINVIEENIGQKYTQEWINEIEIEGETRYSQEIPPGFNDQVKANSEEDEKEKEYRRYSGLKYHPKFGDLIIWKDIIKYSKSKSSKKSKVIYVTNDGRSSKKTDLLYKVKDSIIGPDIYLMNELQMEAQKELYILSNTRFVQLVNELTETEAEELELSLINKQMKTKPKQRLSSRNSENSYQRYLAKNKYKALEDLEDAEAIIEAKEAKKTYLSKKISDLHEDFNFYKAILDSTSDDTDYTEKDYLYNKLTKIMNETDNLEMELAVIHKKMLDIERNYITNTKTYLDLGVDDEY